MSESEAPVLVSKEGAVGIATLNRPTKFNCISRELAALGILGAAVREFDSGPPVVADLTVAVPDFSATERMIVVATDSAQDLLWAMEEGLRARRFAVVAGGRSRHVQWSDVGAAEPPEHPDRGAGAVSSRVVFEVAIDE